MRGMCCSAAAPVCAGITSLTKHSHLDRLLMKGFIFVVVVLCIRIHTNRSTPILILCFRFLSHSSFTFALRTWGILALCYYVCTIWLLLLALHWLETSIECSNSNGDRWHKTTAKAVLPEERKMLLALLLKLHSPMTFGSLHFFLDNYISCVYCV